MNQKLRKTINTIKCWGFILLSAFLACCVIYFPYWLVGPETFWQRVATIAVLLFIFDWWFILIWIFMTAMVGSALELWDEPQW